MAIYLKRNKADILRQALEKLEGDTNIKATGPGSIARSFTEAITTQLGEMYDVLDYTLAQTVISTANGRSLDLIGSMYGVDRKTVSDFTIIDRSLGAFNFFIDTPYSSDISIPLGTKVYSSIDGFIGRQFTYVTTEDVTIPSGRTKVFASIAPNFDDSVYTAGVGTLNLHNALSPVGVLIQCTNPKAIAPQKNSEDDESYRLRIIKSVRVAAAGTLDAVRFTALGVNGVRDARVRIAPFGLASFEIIISTEDFGTRNQVLSDAVTAVEKARPLGVRMIMRLPDELPIDISISLIVQAMSDKDKELLSVRVRLNILRFLNAFLPGDVLVYNRLIQEILDTSNLIQDVQVTRYAPNGKEALRKNYTPQTDEQVIPGRIEITIA